MRMAYIHTVTQSRHSISLDGYHVTYLHNRSLCINFMEIFNMLFNMDWHVDQVERTFMLE